ncbi:hypothetical protein H4R23_001003 [Coemansia sp. Cherry 401B]|nr:hypothetical protein IWW52_005187 [Coemansia sp. RSA 2704]KAJ2314911.1 hypothetical protein IWW54_000628 [Coemansia sp. RSA 2705]KAJ2738651.1 hypothetical protein H4R23_001003 [Coemansia sp. Cherry 401B]
MSLSTYYVMCKSVLGYYMRGKQLPSWDLKLQVFCDVVRYYSQLRFPECSDDDIDTIDFDQMHRGFQSQPMPPTELSTKVGVYRGFAIDADAQAIDPHTLDGLGLAEQPLRALIEQDARCPRQIPCELVASWTACAAHNIRRDSHKAALEPVPLASSEKIVLCLHGGAYVMGSPASHRETLGKFSACTGLRCLAIDYRLAPRHPFPAQFHDALLAFYYLVAQGFKPKNILLLGDSAGGHLCVGLVMLLKHIAQSTGSQLRPGAVMLLSPMPGLLLDGDSLRTQAMFDYVAPTPLEWPNAPMRLLYKPGHKCTDEYRKELAYPLLTPVNGDLSGFPPTIVQCGGSEVLVDDIRKLAEKLQKDNHERVQVVYDEYPEMVHVFHRFSYRPEADAAFSRLAKFVAELKQPS